MRVLFVSKPVVPPFQDGTKCLVRDIALHADRVTPVVLSTRETPALSDVHRVAASRVELVPVYSNAGSYAPAAVENLRAAAWVLARSRADVWHFVFAPNPRTSQVGRWLRRLRRVPVVQTIASPPRSFEDADALLFGDVIVAQSRWTRDHVLAAYAKKGLRSPDVRVIPPPVPLDLSRSDAECSRFRAEHGIAPDAPVFVYPGDLETSRGAEVCAELAPRIASAVPGAVVVFAYRAKTAGAEGVAERLRERLDPSSTRVLGSLRDVLALVASARAVLFPVDDLWGKVDLPIVLLEAMVLGVPVLAYDQGPLSDLEATRRLPVLDAEPWLAAVLELERDGARRGELIARQRAAATERHAAAVVARAYEELYFELFARGRPLHGRGGSADVASSAMKGSASSD